MHRIGGHHRTIPWLPRASGVAGLTALSVILVASPGVLAFTYTPPYAHSHSSVYNWVRSISGCARGSSSLPTYAPGTANVSWKGKASVGSCGGSLRKALTDNLAEVEGAMELAIPVKVPIGAAKAVQFNVTWNITASGAITGGATGPCIDPLPANTTGSYECIAAALAGLVGGAWLVDLTNGSVFPASNAPIVSGVGAEALNYTICTPNCTSYLYSFTIGTPFSGPQSDSFVINATTNHAHQYDLVTYVGGIADAELEGYVGHATASVDLGTPGSGAQLVSVVET